MKHITFYAHAKYSCLSLFLFLPVGVQAATLFIERIPEVTGNGPITLGVFIRSSTSINTLEAALVLPAALHVIDFSEDGSILAPFVDTPFYDEKTRSLVFSGIVPGGFSGAKGKLLEVRLLSTQIGTADVGFDETRTHVYQNDGLGTKDGVVLERAIVNATSKNTFMHLVWWRYSTLIVTLAVLLCVCVCLAIFLKRHRLTIRYK